MQVCYEIKTQPSLRKEKTALVCVDIQERLFSVMEGKEKLLKNANKLLEVSEILDLNTLVLEQYPKGLGKSVVSSKAEIIEKISFSVFGEEKFCSVLQKQKIENLVFFGIESHVCIWQSACDAIERGFCVYVVEDSCSSRSLYHHHLAMQGLRDIGVKIISSETFLFCLLRDCKDEEFKTVSALVKDQS